MSLSYSDCFSDLLCTEDSGILARNFQDYSSDIEFPADIEESIAGFLEDEGNYVPEFDYPSRFLSRSLDASAREESVAWILKVHALYGFRPLTAYLAVNYMDRFLSSCRLPQTSGWPLQLLSVACVSLAAKMEEPLVPSLLDLQVEGAKFIFEPRTIRKMEILVLNALDWRLRSITPFNFVGFFAYKLDATGTLVGFLMSRATEIILTIIGDTSFLNYWPSSVAAAAILCAANEMPKMSLVSSRNAASWCDGLSKDLVLDCYRLMQEIVVDGSHGKCPKVLPQLIVTTPAGNGSNDSSSSSSVKRRKLNNCLWEYDNKEKH
ncbi:hypothetical protein HHK36_015175 [Tetracentron sinense]|uniref:Uncharacterized protein n=1 Tax=Tetracentron sinense TaxID=13715 RepID=A0A834Z4H8_TETSI|nr:hypothetical protein HHK36_015175 [Tetracentron sinense]